MQNNLNKKQTVWQVGISEQAKTALKNLAQNCKVRGVSASQGMIASTLILRAYENGESVLG